MCVCASVHFEKVITELRVNQLVVLLGYFYYNTNVNPDRGRTMVTVTVSEGERETSRIDVPLNTSYLEQSIRMEFLLHFTLPNRLFELYFSKWNI